MKRWTERCRVIRNRYRYEGSAHVRSRKYQMLWSNIEVMKSAVYAKPPQAVVKRRYTDPDPVAREASEILERDLNTTLDLSDYDSVFKQVRDDFLLYARGVARVYYQPEFELADSGSETISDAVDIEGQRPEDESLEAPEPKLAFEHVKIRYVGRHDYREQPARTADEVEWKAFRAFLGRDELAERFGKEIAANVSFAKDPTSAEDGEGDGASGQLSSQLEKKAEVWEIWDRRKNRVLWVSPSCPDILEEGKPYLQFSGFYPCPRPATGSITQDSTVPIPDYVYYQDQAEEIDQLTARIGALADALKLVGFYPAGPQGEGSPEIEMAMKPGFENKMIAVQSWAVFTEGGGGRAPIVWLPIENVVAIIQSCIELRKQLVQDVYEIIGLSDIMRGATDPRETEGAQQLKAQYGGTRIRDRQQELARFCRDIIRLASEVICSQFRPETIFEMANKKLPTEQDVMQANVQQSLQYQQMVMQAVQMAQQNAATSGEQVQQPQIPPQPEPVDLGPTQEKVMELLGNNVLRRFRVEIENESTVIGDESQEKKDRTELITATSQFLAAWGPMVQVEPELAPLAGKLLTFGVRAFRVGRDLEETLEEVADRIGEKAKKAANSPAPPDPKVQAAQIKAQSDVVKAQTDMAKARTDIEAAQIEAASEAENARLAMDREAMKAQNEAMKDSRKAALEMMKLNAQREKQAAQPKGQQ